jgi:hypothetical protein
MNEPRTTDWVAEAQKLEKPTVRIYVRLGDHGEDADQRSIAFAIPTGIDPMELLEHEFAIDGRDALFTIAQITDERTGSTYFDAPFGKSAETLSRALGMAQRDLVNYLREKGFTPQFA